MILKQFTDYPRNAKIVVNKIISPVLGAEVRKVEDRRRLSEQDRTKIKFLKAAINFLPRWSRPENINNIADKCVRRPRLRSIWIGITSTVSRVCGPLLSLGSTIALAAA
ncbi:hypothetical protein pdam_00025397 [Pocillopora damicornis]|uniref:Uncharacterized protein n=1 Tax=Pocillopora damicornis TaxID=46731 RepID=A0A3M6UDB8_POCDA|nr:hypothetical protein pdam_00025397 [Pocillopora damicornis]